MLCLLGLKNVLSASKQSISSGSSLFVRNFFLGQKHGFFNFFVSSIFFRHSWLARLVVAKKNLLKSCCAVNVSVSGTFSLVAHVVLDNDACTSCACAQIQEEEAL